jgi:Ca-activated chloride channel family protein
VAGAQLLGLSAAVVAVAQPVNREIIRPETEGRIMVLFDVSLSMMATDVPPDRLTAAQEEALAFVDAVRDDVEIGLISFSGTVNVEQQPTRDRLDVKRSIENLELAEATAIGDALATGVRVLTSSLDSGEGGDTGENATDVSPGVIVLMTDGETTFGRTSNEGAELAADANIPVFTIAFGTADGEIEDPYTGDIVPVPAQPEALEEVADISGGEAFEAGSETELADAYGQIDELLQETIGEEEEIVAEQAWKWALTAAGVLTGAWLLSLLLLRTIL